MFCHYQLIILSVYCRERVFIFGDINKRAWVSFPPHSPTSSWKYFQSPTFPATSRTMWIYNVNILQSQPYSVGEKKIQESFISSCWLESHVLSLYGWISFRRLIIVSLFLDFGRKISVFTDNNSLAEENINDLVTKFLSS